MIHNNNPFESHSNSRLQRNRLFYIKRSLNKNIVVYSYNTTRDNELDAQNPINSYWIMKEKGENITEKLSFIERKLAFGHSIVKKDNKIEFYINSLPEMKFYLKQVNDKWICVTEDNKRLQKVYVQLKPGISIFVDYVDIYLLHKGELEKYRIKNK